MIVALQKFLDNAVLARDATVKDGVNMKSDTMGNSRTEGAVLLIRCMLTAIRCRTHISGMSMSNGATQILALVDDTTSDDQCPSTTGETHTEMDVSVDQNRHHIARFREGSVTGAMVGTYSRMREPRATMHPTKTTHDLGMIYGTKNTTDHQAIFPTNDLIAHHDTIIELCGRSRCEE
jgi:hypothetical protein